MAEILGYSLVSMSVVGMGRPDPSIFQSPIYLWRESSDFAARVRRVVRRIPHGRVATYGDVAAAAGRPRAHRAVGNIMRATSDRPSPAIASSLPAASSAVYGRDLFAKRALLLAEGVIVSDGRVRDFAAKAMDTSCIEDWEIEDWKIVGRFYAELLIHRHRPAVRMLERLENDLVHCPRHGYFTRSSTLIADSGVRFSW